MSPSSTAVPSNPPRLVLAAAAAALAAVLSAAAYNHHSVSWPDRDRDRFVRAPVTAREPVSPSSTILTVAPPVIPCHGRLWTVEFKQPEVQIARHYTPLPPCGTDDNRLRFYLRHVEGGEMSAYLTRLSVGDDLWLRGPHLGFDISRRLGCRKRLVLLAGGTGLAPAMQAAVAVLDKPDTSAILLWAVRRPDEIRSTRSSHPWWRKNLLLLHSPTPSELGTQLEEPSSIAVQLSQMKARYGSRLHIRIAIDEDGSIFRDEDIRRALLPPSPPTPSFPSSSAFPASDSTDCQCHDQALHASASEFDPPNDSCRCPSSAAGKNLFIVSGPDGFVSHYAGPKIWSGGTLTQGSLGGVIARLQRRYPSLARDWLVLKL
ncbi:hypothetical protein CP533_4647 [Ophiocordyceps camponoti-saundersi (nom. inval.)]|nr:hypothetical protein CP533_4647 [Ophiocordyceps camponoti-saundersi (nom. inval.)]